MPSAPFPRARAGKNQACVLLFVAASRRGKDPRGIKQKGQAVKHLKGDEGETQRKTNMAWEWRSRENDGVVLVFL